MACHCEHFFICLFTCTAVALNRIWGYWIISQSRTIATVHLNAILDLIVKNQKWFSFQIPNNSDINILKRWQKRLNRLWRSLILQKKNNNNFCLILFFFFNIRMVDVSCENRHSCHKDNGSAEETLSIQIVRLFISYQKLLFC